MVGDSIALELFVLVAIFSIGLVAGLLLRRRLGGNRARVAELERQILELRDHEAAYRERVEKHFDQTAHLFRDLSAQHVALFQQLCSGMQELAPNAKRLAPPAFAAPPLDLDESLQLPENGARVAGPRSDAHAEDESSQVA